MGYGEQCVPNNGNATSGGYQLQILQKPSDPIEGAPVELGCTSDSEAYVLALKFLQTIDFKIHSARLKNPKGQPMMYYTPKKGWYFGDDRDLAVV